MGEFFLAHGALGLFLLSLCEASFFPLAPDFLLMPLVVAEPDRVALLVGLASAGGLLGSAFGYGVGYYGGRPLLLRLADAEQVERVERAFNRHGAWAVAVAGFLPPFPYKFFTLASGACRLRPSAFLVAGGVSRTLRFAVVGALVWHYGEEVSLTPDQVRLVLLSALATGSTLWAVSTLWRRRRKRVSQSR